MKVFQNGSRTSGRVRMILCTLSTPPSLLRMSPSGRSRRRSDRSSMTASRDSRPEHAVAVNLMDALGDVAPGVLLLLHLHERLWIRALNANENPEEVHVLHRLQQLVIVRDIDRGFGRELERIVALFLPGLEPRQ